MQSLRLSMKVALSSVDSLLTAKACDSFQAVDSSRINSLVPCPGLRFPRSLRRSLNRRRNKGRNNTVGWLLEGICVSRGTSGGNARRGAREEERQQEGRSRLRVRNSSPALALPVSPPTADCVPTLGQRLRHQISVLSSQLSVPSPDPDVRRANRPSPSPPLASYNI